MMTSLSQTGGSRPPGAMNTQTRLSSCRGLARSDIAAHLGSAVLAVICALFLPGCAGNKTPWTSFAKQKHPWGYYSGPVDTRWNSDGRTMTLLNELRYVDPKGQVWVAPAGSVVDGASIPRALWPFVTMG